MTTASPLSRRLAEFSLGLRFEDLPEAVVESAVRAIADTLACATAATDEPGPAILRQYALRHAGEAEGTLIGTGERVDKALAALVNCTLARDLDANDLYAGPPGRDTGHFSDAIPAVLAAAEASGADGKQLITSVVIAYEVQAALAESYLWMRRGLHSVSQVAWAVPPAVAPLLGLDEEQLVSAIGLAGSTSGLILQSWLKPDADIPMLKGGSAGFAAQGGLLAAELARAGFTGPAAALEDLFRQLPSDADTDPITALGRARAFAISRNMVKRYPAQIYLQPAIELALALQAKLDESDAIASVRVEGHRGTCSGVRASKAAYAPGTRATADHSAPFVIAVSLLDGAFTHDAYRQEAWLRDDVRSLMAQVELVIDPELDSALVGEGQMGCRMTVRLSDGRRISHEVAQQQGHPERPLSEDELSAKIDELVDPQLGAGAGANLVAAVRSLPDAEDLSQLLASLQRPS